MYRATWNKNNLWQMHHINLITIVSLIDCGYETMEHCEHSFVCFLLVMLVWFET